MKHENRDKLQGVVTGLQPYGAFVELETGVTGLIHISEIRSGYIDNIHDILKIGVKFVPRLSILMNTLGRLACLFVP